MKISYDELEDKAREILEDNDELFNDVCEDLDAWDGFLDDDRLYPMCELEELYSGMNLIEFLELIDGNDFDVNDEYFYHDIYGLHSTDDRDYKAVKSVEEVLDALKDNYMHCDYSLRGEFLGDILEALDECADYYEFDEENETVEAIEEDEDEE
jgi:hypothetical protein